ncbi:HEAT repeat domain-containing protein [Thiotrichales bacterium HSG1]|nr:HEAT repeat domain-containing protein [Thiotrichales bacterium HSG1]
MTTTQIFLASSAELREDRKELKLNIAGKNDMLNEKEVYLKLITWEDSFVNAMVEYGLQTEYDEAIKQCDVIIFLFWTLAGKYTLHEFDVAYEQFKLTGKPKIYTYFKQTEQRNQALNDFQIKLANSEQYGNEQYYDKYENKHDLCNQVYDQLEKLGVTGGDNFDWDKYAERVRIRYQVLDLSALTPPSRDDVDDGGILLKDVFVPQMVRESRPPRELPKEILDRLYAKGELEADELSDELREDDFKRLQDNWTQAQPESVLTVVAKPDNNRLILLGDPGSGKSTLARYLLLSVLARNLEFFATGGHLPLLVELRNYMGEVAGNKCCGFLEYFHNLGKAEGYTFNSVELKELLKTRPSLVIFDGLDEIFDPVEREKITQQIIGFALDYQDKARVLVTSRIVGYQGKALQAADFYEYTLQDLELEQIKSFARGWFDLVFRDKVNEADFRYQRIETALKSSPAIRQLAGNPLLLTMIAIIAKHQELPKKRAKLYEHATKVLCHHWDVTGHKISVEETPANFMYEDDKLELLRRVAWRMQASEKGLSGNFILGDDLLAEIAEYLRVRWQLPETEVGRMSRGMVDQLWERNFILCLYGASLYGFVHRTFLEYFCAAEIFDRLQYGADNEISPEELEKDIFLAHCQDSAWHEVLRLICGMVKPKVAGKLIGAILPERKEAFEKTDDLILTVQCLAEVADINQIADVAEQVLGSLCGWFEDTADRDEVDNFDKKEQQFEEYAVPAVEMISKSWPRREKFLGWLSKPEKKVRSWQGMYAFGKVVAALWNDSKTTKQSLIDLSKNIKYISIPAMAFDALTHCFKKETYLLLQQVIQDEKHEYIRCAAVLSLAGHYQDRQETYSLLQQIIQGDKHEYVRSTAISSLAEHYQDRPKTYSLLQKVVQDDGHEYGRRAAVSSLAEYYKDRTETYLLLQQVIQDDKHEYVRSAAIEAIAKHYHDEAWQKLLTKNFDGKWPWLDSKSTVKKKQVWKATKKLNLPHATIRKYYEDIAKEIPLRLEWKE